MCYITFVTNVIFLLHDICASINSSTNKFSNMYSFPSCTHIKYQINIFFNIEMKKKIFCTILSPIFIGSLLFSLYSAFALFSFVQRCKSGGQCNKSLRIYEVQYLMCTNWTEVRKICGTICYSSCELFEEEKQVVLCQMIYLLHFWCSSYLAHV
jgi:hypothetical protein